MSDTKRLGWAFEAAHAAAMGVVFPHLAGAMHGREMSFSQLTALFHVFIRGPQTIAELASAVDLTHNATSRMVDRLVQGGLCTRDEDREDRRRKRIGLTQKGRDFFPNLREATARAYADMLAPLPPALLERLEAAMAEVEPLLPKKPEPVV